MDPEKPRGQSERHRRMVHHDRWVLPTRCCRGVRDRLPALRSPSSRVRPDQPDPFGPVRVRRVPARPWRRSATWGRTAGGGNLDPELSWRTHGGIVGERTDRVAARPVLGVRRRRGGARSRGGSLRLLVARVAQQRGGSAAAGHPGLRPCVPAGRPETGPHGSADRQASRYRRGLRRDQVAIGRDVAVLGSVVLQVHAGPGHSGEEPARVRGPNPDALRRGRAPGDARPVCRASSPATCAS
jgi:hypothetical protein